MTVFSQLRDRQVWQSSLSHQQRLHAVLPTMEHTP